MTRRSNRLLASSATAALALAAISTPAHAIVPNETTDSEEIVDTDDEFAGVGQFFSNSGIDGETGLGLCTGTLINPRAVLFAAHCVNSLPATAYNDGTRISSFGFNVDNLPAVREWLAPFIDPNGGLVFRTDGLTDEEIAALTPNPILRSTSIANNLYNISQIQYDPRSLQNPQAQGFIEADVALATLDTPAVNLPTWALLFSILPTPESIDPSTGTGYNVNITGYGGTGNAFEGDVEGIDFRRRAAENVLGGFLSLDDRNNAIFGPADPFLPQNLYQTDFDSRTPEAFFFDINTYQDDARPNEGTTAGGDSGGPLILDAANNDFTDEDLVIGVLSGGSGFFGSFSSLGTSSFYQPLALYWEYIVASNPYRYVGTAGGDGDWEDASHWVSLIDPNYRAIDADGNIINGLPTTPELGLNGTEGDFGKVCVEGISAPALGPDQCFDTSTGVISPSGPPAEAADEATGSGASNISSNIGWADVSLVANTIEGVSDAAISGNVTSIESVQDAAINGNVTSIDAVQDVAIDGNVASVESVENEAQEDGDAPMLPDATIENGLPGATDFIPDNIDPGFGDGGDVINGRYFDVTLANAGTTTLSSEREIDRLTVSGSAGLDITAGGDLDVLIDINQMGGVVNVDGNLSSVGDYSLFTGVLLGSGTVASPFLTNIAGAISPGTMGGIDTLTIDGNAILSSGSTLMIDLGAAGESDTLNVTGIANVGGVVSVGTGVFDVVNGNGQQYTIVTADGGVTGEFTENSISSILSTNYIYEANAVLLEIEAASFGTVIQSSDPVQTAYAQLLDQNRGNSALSELFALDFLSAEDIRSTLNGLAPTPETAVRTLSGQSFTQMMNFNSNRLSTSSRSRSGGTVATLSSPLKGLGNELARATQPQTANDLGLAETDIEEGAIPDNMAIYFAGGYVDGEGDSMSGFQQSRTEFDGYYAATGLELFPSENSLVGASIYYVDLDADGALGSTANSEMWALSLYGRTKTSGNIVLEGQVSISDYSVDTERTVSIGGNQQTLRSDRGSTGVSGGIGISYEMDIAVGTLAPGVETNYAKISSDAVTETGGTAALSIARQSFESFQGRVGVDFTTKADRKIQFHADVDLVHEFESGPQLFQANFVNGVGPTAGFAYNPTDRNWVEVGLAASIGDGPVTFGLGVDTTFGRSNVEASTYTASATFSF